MLTTSPCGMLESENGLDLDLGSGGSMVLDIGTQSALSALRSLRARINLLTSVGAMTWASGFRAKWITTKFGSS